MQIAFGRVRRKTSPTDFKGRVGKCKAKTNCATTAQFGDSSYRRVDCKIKRRYDMITYQCSFYCDKGNRV